MKDNYYSKSYQDVSSRQVSVDEVHLRQVLHAVGDAPHHADQLHDLKKEFEIIFMFYGVFELKYIQ